MLDTTFVDILKTLVRQPSVVGAEHAFFRVIQRELEELGARVTWYEGLLVAQGSNPHAHMFPPTSTVTASSVQAPTNFNMPPM